MRLIFTVAILAAASVAADARNCVTSRDRRNTNRAGCSSSIPAAFFEAANASGTGTGAACACAAVTGAKGETVTWTRGGSAYCTKEGLATTGLTTTSMVLCGSNLPRVEADGSGVLGWLVESARTNLALQSEALDNAAVWPNTGAVVAAPIVTANQATTPWGTTTAERVQFAATDSSGSQYTASYQAVGAAAGVYIVSAYLRGNGFTGIVDVCTTTIGGGACTACAVNPTTWVRCITPASSPAGTGAIFIGNMSLSNYNGSVARPASDVFIAGAQTEAGAYATSYIAATTIAVARVTDANAINGATLPGAPFSMSAFVTTEWASTGGSGFQGIIEGQVGSVSGVGLFFLSGTGSFRLQTLNTGALSITTAGNTMLAGTAYKVGSANLGGNSSAYFGGALVSGPTATNNAAQPWYSATGIGYSPAFPAPLDGIISRVKIDNTATGGL